MTTSAKRKPEERINAGAVLEAARGRWREVLEALVPGIDLSGRHGPCPGCGGRDRFRIVPAELDERGGWFCGGGGETTGGDGLALLRHVHGWSFEEAIGRVAGVLGMDAQAAAPARGRGGRRNPSHKATVPRSPAPAPRGGHVRADDQARAARQARALWERARPAGADHPYLRRKGVRPAAGLRELSVDDVLEATGWQPKGKDGPLTGRLLVAPVGDLEGVTSLELIDEEGRKAFLPGGRVKGCWWAAEPLPEQVERILVAEGVATALTARQGTGWPAVAALSVSGLRPVAEALRRRHPEAHIVVLAEIGQEPAAREAARAVEGAVAIPTFEGAAEGADLNDMAQAVGLDAVREAIEGAHDLGSAILEVRRASDVPRRELRWLWPGVIPLGKLSVIAGNPGLGKSLLTCWLAGVVTTGGRWPLGGGCCEPAEALLFSAEDDPEDTIRPRLEAAGARLERVHLAGMTLLIDEHGRPQRRMFSLLEDVGRLDRFLARHQRIRLVVIDPVTAYTAGVDTHRTADVRGMLAPLAEVASRRGVAVVAVTHLNKGAGAQLSEALHRVTGSIAWVAAARAAVLVAKDPGDPDRRLVMVAKNNLAPDRLGLAYRVRLGAHGPVVEWESEPVSASVEEVLAGGEQAEDRTATDEAVDFLADLLAGGPVEAAKAIKEAKRLGISEKALRRARERLGVRARKREFAGGWVWERSARVAHEDAQDAPKAPKAPQFRNGASWASSGHLRGDAPSSADVVSGLGPGPAEGQGEDMEPLVGVVDGLAGENDDDGPALEI